jgi:hypothetical protein
LDERPCLYFHDGFIQVAEFVEQELNKHILKHKSKYCFQIRVSLNLRNRDGANRTKTKVLGFSETRL